MNASVYSESGGHTVVTFQLEEKTYALPLASVLQIIPLVALTPLPQAHPAVAGVMNFRGRAVPVIHMRRYFGLAEAQPGLYTPIVLTQAGNRTVGLIVDTVVDVLDLSPTRMVSLVEIMPEGLGEIPMLEGLSHADNGTILLLDLSHLFTAAGAAATAHVSRMSDIGNGALSSAPVPAAESPGPADAHEV